MVEKVYDRYEREQAIAWMNEALLELLLADNAPDSCAMESQLLKARAYAIAIDCLGAY